MSMAERRWMYMQCRLPEVYPEGTAGEGRRNEAHVKFYEPLRFAVEKLKFRNSNLSFEFVRLSAEKVLWALLSMDGELRVEC